MFNEKQRKLLDWVIMNEIAVPITTVVVREWMLENIGEQRPYHPYMEALEGYIDYFDGDWAAEPSCLNELNYYWFASKTGAVKFRLMYGGIPSPRKHLLQEDR